MPNKLLKNAFIILAPLVLIFLSASVSLATHSGNRFQWNSGNASIVQTHISDNSKITFKYLGNGCSVNYEGFVTKASGMSCQSGSFALPMDYFGYIAKDKTTHYFIKAIKGAKEGGKFTITGPGALGASSEDIPHKITISGLAAGEGTVVPGADDDGNGKEDAKEAGTSESATGSDSPTSAKSTLQDPVQISDEMKEAKEPTYKPRIFLNPTGCKYSTQPLKCWTKQAFDFATIAVGSIAVVAIMVGGVFYMASGGNPDRVALGKKTIYNALIGVAIILLANWFFRSIIGINNWGL